MREARSAEVTSCAGAGSRRDPIQAIAARGSEDRAPGSRARRDQSGAETARRQRGRARSQVRWPSRSGEVELASAGRAYEPAAEAGREENLVRGRKERTVRGLELCEAPVGV